VGIWGDDVELNTEIPFKVSVIETGTIDYLGQEVKVKFVDANGKFQFKDTPPIVKRSNTIPMFVIFPMMFWIVSLFHRFITNVYNGKIFEKTNFKLLQKLGLALGILWLFAVVYIHLMKYFFFGEIQFLTIEFVVERGKWFSELFVAALFIYTLSHVFLKGLELQEENELTI